MYCLDNIFLRYIILFVNEIVLRTMCAIAINVTDTHPPCYTAAQQERRSPFLEINFQPRKGMCPCHSIERRRSSVILSKTTTSSLPSHQSDRKMRSASTPFFRRTPSFDCPLCRDCGHDRGSPKRHLESRNARQPYGCSARDLSFLTYVTTFWDISW